MRALGLHPVDDTRRAYRALLTAMSRPGTITATPAPADRAIVATLADHEVGLATDDERLRGALSDAGRLDERPIDTAAIVHARDHATWRDQEDWDVRSVRRGTREAPSTGATVVYRVDGLGAATTDGLDADDPTTLELSGPGVDGSARLDVTLSADECRAIASAQADFPCGIDAVFASEDCVAAVPRSATMAVV